MKAVTNLSCSSGVQRKPAPCFFFSGVRATPRPALLGLLCFFLAMAALDSACAVLEPELKRGGEDVAHRFNYRRISLGGRCACVVTFRDPRQAWPRLAA